jgi:oxygen-independent coproporphyrinogen-3 oxidase
MTERAGLPAYEVSNHAAPGEESRHNLLYWRYGEYAGVGAGAHGRILAHGARQATVTERNPERWAELVEAHGHGLTEMTALASGEEADEALLMGLRLTEGVRLDRLAMLAGLSSGVAEVERLVGLGLMHRPAPNRIAATAAGRMVLNELVARLAATFEPAAAAIED